MLLPRPIATFGPVALRRPLYLLAAVLGVVALILGLVNAWNVLGPAPVLAVLLWAAIGTALCFFVAWRRALWRLQLAEDRAAMADNVVTEWQARFDSRTMDWAEGVRLSSQLKRRLRSAQEAIEREHRKSYVLVNALRLLVPVCGDAVDDALKTASKGEVMERALANGTGERPSTASQAVSCSGEVPPVGCLTDTLRALEAALDLSDVTAEEPQDGDVSLVDPESGSLSPDSVGTVVATDSEFYALQSVLLAEAETGGPRE